MRKILGATALLVSLCAHGQDVTWKVGGDDLRGLHPHGRDELVLGRGWELLLRHDHNKPDRNSGVVRQRNITGGAYWIPNLQKVTCAVLVDRDALSVTGKDDDTKYGVKMVLSF